MFIELRKYKQRKPIFLNINHIMRVVPDIDGYEPDSYDGTLIWLTGQIESILVGNDYEDVVNKIKEAQK